MGWRDYLAVHLAWVVPEAEAVPVLVERAAEPRVLAMHQATAELVLEGWEEPVLEGWAELGARAVHPTRGLRGLLV